MSSNTDKKVKKNKYMSALKEFVKGTIDNPAFFEKSPEEQKNEAFEILQKHKNNNENELNEK